MKTQAILALTLSASSALATPIWGNWGGRGGSGKDGKDRSKVNFPYEFTSTFSVVATPDQVVNGTTPTGGLQGASGKYDLYLNADKNFICWYISLSGFQGEYQSPALTATHIHEALRGTSGPPRIAFSNPIPTGKGDERISVGCQQGPFKTGVNGTDGVDSGRNFNVKKIQDNPAAFFADVHSTLAVPGAVRGQIA